jgi:hypothetical protein
VKNEAIGIVSWVTRGQLGVERKITATTGFQSSGYDHNELVTHFRETLKSDKKYFEFTQVRLRTAKDILKSGGHGTQILKA